jgi:uncharacterized protein (DUF1499 family)
MATNNVSRAAHFGEMLGLAAAGFAIVGVGGAALGILPSFGGFLVMVLGLGMALVGLVTSIVGLVATSPGKGREGRGAAMRGLLLSIGVIVALAIPASQGRDVPRINDITTNLEDPPVFVKAAELQPDRDMAYPGTSFAEQQQQGYPDLATLVIEDAPEAAFDKVHEALAGMPRMAITDASRGEGRIEATETSALFRFKDDVVVRIRPFQDGGSRIDVRSKSRDGKGDMGVNASRIRTLFALMRASAAPAASASAPANENAAAPAAGQLAAPAAGQIAAPAAQPATPAAQGAAPAAQGH